MHDFTQINIILLFLKEKRPSSEAQGEVPDRGGEICHYML